MKTKKELSAIARKAWRTRRRNSKAGTEAVKRNYPKRARHLAAMRAWATRRENLSHVGIGVYKALVPDDLETMVISDEPSRKDKRHLAAVKAWKTRRANKK